MSDALGTTLGLIQFSDSSAAVQELSHTERLRHRVAQPGWSPITGPGPRLKRGLDIIIALGALMFWAIPMLLAAIAIKLESPGPVLFRQRRIGLNNRSFELWKLRTMYRHKPERGRLRQTTRRDPRVTRVGAFLRHRSLDEVPQLVQVLLGDMSLVGPRPHAPGTCAGGIPFELISDRYRLRHQVRPGMTGLAQVRGWRGETDTPDKLMRRLESDMEYIETWSVWLDLKVLARSTASGTRHAQRLLRAQIVTIILEQQADADVFQDVRRDWQFEPAPFPRPLIFPPNDPPVAVLIPCFNEEATIGKVVSDFRASLPNATIYVYDNNSRDHTALEARADCRGPPGTTGPAADPAACGPRLSAA